MRSADEQLRMIRQKAEKRKQKQQTMLLRSATVLCSMALAAFLGLVLPRLDGVTLPEGTLTGSVVFLRPQLGYIVLAILAFCLGVFVTLLCVHHKEQKGDKEDEES